MAAATMPAVAGPTGRQCLAASTSDHQRWVRASALPRSRRRLLALPLSAAAKDGGGSSSGFAEAAQRLAGDAQRRVSDLMKEHQVERKLRSGWQETQVSEAPSRMHARIAQTTQHLLPSRVPRVPAPQDSIKAGAWKIDSEYDVSGKANRAARQAQQAAADVDQKYGVRRWMRRSHPVLFFFGGGGGGAPPAPAPRLPWGATTPRGAARRALSMLGRAAG